MRWTLLITMALFCSSALAQETEGDCSHLTAEQMGDKDACWVTKKAELGLTRADTESSVEYVTTRQLPSMANTSASFLSEETNYNIYDVPFFKDAASRQGRPSPLAPGSGQDSKTGNQ